jgi:DMSO/TMAO reductase YedYZ molybdopterin-dependent catalytic subunit
MPGPTSPTRRQLAGGLSGLLAGAAAIAVSEGVAAVLPGVTSPLLAVGNRAVDATPQPVKEWAIATFGSHDKQVLIGGVVATVALLAVVAGVLGARRPRVALGAFVVLSVVAGLAVATDRASTAGLALRLLPVLALVVVGVGALVLLLRTLRAPGRVEDDDLPASFDRRAFLQAAAVVGGAVVVGGGVRQAFGGSAAAHDRAGITLPRPASPAPPLPAGASLDVTGITPHLTSSSSFYRVDTALRVPDVPLDGYTLKVHGLVDKELELTFEDLLRRRLVERRITLTCVSNPVGGGYVGNATWLGVPVRDLLEEAGVRSGADAVRSTSTDKMTIGTPLHALDDPDRDALIAVGMNGRPLPLEHGFPVRMVVPGLYGYVSATKWLVDLEVTRFADFKAYWSTRGYSVKAPIKTSSRIDVPKPFQRVRAGRVPVAGVAWSQDRGIRKVEVAVDGGRWHRADLAAQDSIDTWRQWVWMWDAEPGNHTLEVRATDDTGYTQTDVRAPIAPNGSTGWHNVNVTVA